MSTEAGVAPAGLDKWRPLLLRGVGVIAALTAALLLTVHLRTATGDGLTAGNGLAFGDDTINFWGAAHLAAVGRIGEVYDRPAFHAFHVATLGGPVHLYEYSYPPVAILLTLPLGLLPYPLAVAAWLGGGWLVFALVLGGVWRRAFGAGGGAQDWLLYSLACPPVFANWLNGQIGSWLAAAIGGGLLLLGRRPVLGGAVLGLLVVKPQLALLVPLALLAARQWRALCSCAATAAVLLAASVAVFGTGPWRDFFAYLQVFRQGLEDGPAIRPWQPTVFALVRGAMAPVPVAYAAQAAAALAAAVAVAWVWFRPATAARRNAVLVMAMLFVSPYLNMYDLPVTAFVPLWLLGDSNRQAPVLAAGALLLATPILGAWSALSLGVGAGCLALLPAAVLALPRHRPPATAAAAP